VISLIKKTETEITGFYKSEKCNMTIEITNHRSDYKYHLVTDNRNEKGKAIISFEKGKDGYFIELRDEKVTEPDKMNKIENIHFFVSNDTITLQNYGNSINQYQQINCEEKYIILVKNKNHR
jgi:hypothetical protein